MYTFLITRLLLARHRDERGATATEYGLLVAFIAIAIIVAVTAFGTALSGLYDDLTPYVPVI